MIQDVVVVAVCGPRVAESGGRPAVLAEWRYGMDDARTVGRTVPSFRSGSYFEALGAEGGALVDVEVQSGPPFPFDGDRMLPVVNPKVIFKALSDGAVLFSTEDEVYFGLNEVGALVWQLLPPKLSTLDELCRAVAERYPDVDSDVIRQDVTELIAELTSNRLVFPRNAEPSDDSSLENPSQETDQAESARVG